MLGCPDFGRWLRWPGLDIGWSDNVAAFVDAALPLARAADRRRRDVVRRAPRQAGRLRRRVPARRASTACGPAAPSSGCASIPPTWPPLGFDPVDVPRLDRRRAGLRARQGRRALDRPIDPPGPGLGPLRPAAGDPVPGGAVGPARLARHPRATCSRAGSTGRSSSSTRICSSTASWASPEPAGSSGRWRASSRLGHGGEPGPDPVRRRRRIGDQGGRARRSGERRVRPRSAGPRLTLSAPTADSLVGTIAADLGEPTGSRSGSQGWSGPGGCSPPPSSSPRRGRARTIDPSWPRPGPASTCRASCRGASGARRSWPTTPTSTAPAWWRPGARAGHHPRHRVRHRGVPRRRGVPAPGARPPSVPGRRDLQPAARRRRQAGRGAGGLEPAGARCARRRPTSSCSPTRCGRRRQRTPPDRSPAAERVVVTQDAGLTAPSRNTPEPNPVPRVITSSRPRTATTPAPWTSASLATERRAGEAPRQLVL